jgi:hypothetical protein
MLVEGLAQADGDGFEIPAGQAAIGRKAFRHDQDVAFLVGKIRVIGAQESTDVGKGILLCRHRAAIGITKHFPCDIDRRDIGISFLAVLDEVRVFSKPTGVNVERNTRGFRDTADFPDVGHRHRLSTAGVVGNGHHDDRYVFRAM